jgi:hypothetical protein
MRLSLYRMGIFFQAKSEKLMKESLTSIAGFAGQRARDPPDPTPNSEVKPCSVPSCSAVFGRANLGKLAAHFVLGKQGRELAKLYN